MSRAITIQDTIAKDIVGYDTSDHAWYSTSNMENGYHDSSNTSYAQVNLTRNSNAVTYVYWIFDSFSAIPDGASITSVSCSCKCSINTTSSSRVTTRQAQLYSGTTAKGTAYTVANSTTAFSISAGSWTRAELQNARLRLYAVRGTSNTTSSYYFRFYGATLTVAYSYNGTAYTITASSSVPAVTVAPASQELMDGETAIVTISDSTDVIVTDNGNDVTSQLVAKTSDGYSYSVETASGASYGFALNSNDYYESQNKGVDKSAAVCVVSFHLEAAATVRFSYINYAESTYDFGIFGNIDETLNNNYKPASGDMPDSSYRKACNTSSDNTSSVQTLDYSMAAGDHFIYVKYSKDDGTSSNNDTLQFKVAVTITGEYTPDVYYEYAMANLSADHTILVSPALVIPFRIKQNGTWQTVTKVLVKQNGTWVEATKILVKQNGTWDS